MKYPWYEIIQLSDAIHILQGDIILACPVIIPPINYKKGSTPKVDVFEYNVIVMTQSCDLENDKVNIVLVCPYYTWSEFIKDDPSVQSQKGKEKLWDNLKKGAEPAYHLLMSDNEGILKEPIIVVFNDIFGIHISTLREHLKQFKNRLRLLPPYREHLSQAFARYFMRVGLPQNIPSFSVQFPSSK